MPGSTRRGAKKFRERLLAFESWEGLAQVMTGERYRLPPHLHGHPEPSVSALARALGRQYRRAHADVAPLEQAGVVGLEDGSVRALADRIGVEIRP
jgi:predicted transcriptional regulator